MDAIEFLNIIIPKHEKDDCTDIGLENGFWTKYGYSDLTNWSGGCRRCMALEIIEKTNSVPKLADLSTIL